MDAKGNAGGEREGGGLGQPRSPAVDESNQLSPAIDAFLASLAELLIQRAAPEKIAALVLDAAKGLTASPHGYVAYVDPASGKLVCPVLTDDVWERCRVAGRQIGLHNFRGLLGWVREHRQPLLSNAPAADPRAGGVPPGHLSITRLLSVPVVKGETLLGQISLANAPRDYGAQDQANLERLAELFALALRRSLDELELERTCRELDARVLERTGHLAEANHRLQRETAQRLRAEQEMDTLFQVSPDLICVADLSGRFTRVNPAFEMTLGYSSQEALARPILDFVHPDDRQKTMEEMELSFSPQGTRGFENRYLAKDGHVVWMSWSARPAAENGLTYAVGRDISRRKGIEQALRESDAHFRMIFEQSPVGVALISADHRFEQVNQEYCRFLGRSAEELKGMPFQQVTHPDELALDMAYARALQAGEMDSCIREKRYLRADGQTVWGRARVSVVRDAQGRPEHAVALVEDITEERQSEQRRILAGQRQAALLALYSMSDRGRQEICDFALEEGVRLTGSELGYLYFMSEDERTLSVYSWSRRTHELCTVPGQPSVYNVADTGLWGEAVRQRRPIITNDYDAPNPHKKGLPEGHPTLTRHMNLPIFDGGRIVAVAGVANKPSDYDEDDVAMLQLLMGGMWSVIQRQRDQEALRQSEEKFAKAFQAGPVYMIISDLGDGRILEVNEAFAKALGYARQEMIGRTAAELNIWRDPLQRKAMIEAVLREGGLRDMEAEACTRDGGTFTSLVSAERIQVGGRDCLLGVALDISERKALEEQARLAQKRESLAIMAGGVAHDFNNLLQTILGNADLALLDAPPQSPMADNLREVQAAAQRAAELAHKMLAYSGHTPFLPRPLKLSEEVRQALPQLSQGLPAWVGLEHDLPAGLPALEGDASLLRQALQNLLANAVEALDSRPGTITVSTGVGHCDQALLESTYLGRGLPPGEYVFLRVDDSGPGMDPETASKAFDPFFTTKFPGRGLGLAVVLGVVRAHRGAVRIEPRPGGGSRVSLYLPVAQPASVPASNPNGGGAPASWLVLLADDEEAVRVVTRRMLEKHGFSVLTAADGGQAVDILGQRGGEIGAVLLDMNMPGASGEGLVRRMLSLDTGARIIVSSSLEQSQAETSLGSCAISGFIQKPYRMTALIALLRQALGEPSVRS
jgi:PAS domain S-box-containing protein